MAFIKTLTLATLAASLASASPVTKRNTMHISQVANPNYVRNGPAAYAKALRKYNANPEKINSVQKAADGSTGSVTATPQANDSEYLCPVTVGDQTFNLDFDTGSSDLWVFGQGSSGGSHTEYAPSGSASQLQGETWQIQYGDGSSASGIVYSDTVNVGGVTVTGQAVEAATSAAAAFTGGAPDGLLGLAFDSINTCSPQQESTFFTNAINSGVDGVLTANLNAGQPGSYNFGYIDSSEYSGNIAYTPVDNSQGFWGFTPDSVTIGDNGSPQTADAGIADTGTSLILVSDGVVQAYYAQVDGSQNSSDDGGYIFPCSATLPDFIVTIAGQAFTVPGSYMNYASTGDGTNCFGGIQSDGGVGQAIYGDVFLKSVFVVFDRSGSSPQLGVANKA